MISREAYQSAPCGFGSHHDLGRRIGNQIGLFPMQLHQDGHAGGNSHVNLMHSSATIHDAPPAPAENRINDGRGT